MTLLHIDLHLCPHVWQRGSFVYSYFMETLQISEQQRKNKQNKQKKVSPSGVFINFLVVFFMQRRDNVDKVRTQTPRWLCASVPVMDSQ